MTGWYWHEEWNDAVGEKEKPITLVESRSFGLVGSIEMIGGDGRILVKFNNGMNHWLPQSDLTIVADAEEIRQYIARKMDDEVFTIGNPKGLLNVAKQVRLFVGEGDDRLEIGTADIEKIGNGDSAVTLTIVNENVAKLLGGTEIRGIIPRLPSIETDEETS